MRTEYDLWKLVDENFDRFFSNKADRVNCICDCVLVMGFPKYGILTYEERDFMLEKLKKIGEEEFGISRYIISPFWKYGEREPRKEFIKQKIRQNEKTK